jgi:elongation factor 3
MYRATIDQLPCCRFPTPGLLDGITSKEKHICKLTGVSFSYPRTDKFRLADVDVAVRLSSRVAVIGPNGAGKSVSQGSGVLSLQCQAAAVMVLSL